MCDGEYHGQMDGRKGFPSAHACFAFCCMTYMVIHLYHVLDLKRPRFLKGVIIVGMSLLMLVACGVAVSRTMDYHNNYSGNGAITLAIQFAAKSFKSQIGFLI